MSRIYTNVFYAYQVTTLPANSPLTLDEVKAHLRIETSDDDTYLQFLIDAVTACFEKYTNRVLINTTFLAYLDAFPCNNIPCYIECCEVDCCLPSGIQIKKGNTHTVNFIKYLLDTVLTTWNSSNYYMDINNFYPSIHLEEDSVYPTADDKKQAIQIEFIAGYGADNTSVPDDIKLALLNHIAFLYSNRGDCVDAGAAAANACMLPCATKMIYDKYRIQPLAFEKLK